MQTSRELTIFLLRRVIEPAVLSLKTKGITKSYLNYAN